MMTSPPRPQVRKQRHQVDPLALNVEDFHQQFAKLRGEAVECGPKKPFKRTPKEPETGAAVLMIADAILRSFR